MRKKQHNFVDEQNSVIISMHM